MWDKSGHLFEEPLRTKRGLAQYRVGVLAKRANLRADENRIILPLASRITHHACYNYKLQDALDDGSTRYHTPGAM